MPRPNLVPDDGYRELLDHLKHRIQSAQVKAAIAINQELTHLYWHIGREILIRQEQQGWGNKVIDCLSADLKEAFPEMQGLLEVQFEIYARLRQSLAGSARSANWPA